MNSSNIPSRFCPNTVALALVAKHVESTAKATTRSAGMMCLTICFWNYNIWCTFCIFFYLFVFLFLPLARTVERVLSCQGLHSSSTDAVCSYNDVVAIPICHSTQAKVKANANAKADANASRMPMPVEQSNANMHARIPNAKATPNSMIRTSWRGEIAKLPMTISPSLF